MVIRAEQTAVAARKSSVCKIILAFAEYSQFKQELQLSLVHRAADPFECDCDALAPADAHCCKRL